MRMTKEFKEKLVSTLKKLDNEKKEDERINILESVYLIGVNDGITLTKTL